MEKEEMHHEWQEKNLNARSHLKRKASKAEVARKKQDQLLARREAIATFLVENGFADINAKRRRMLSTTYPLHVAAELGDGKLVGFLLEEGADPMRRNSSGRT